MHGGAAEHPLALAEGRGDAVVGDRSDDGDWHGEKLDPIASRAMRAIQMTEFGGPEVLKLVELPEPQPAAGEVLIRSHARA